MNAKVQNGLCALQYKDIDGLRIRYATNGTRDGDSILLLSPLPESILAFLPTWDVFSESGPIVAIDLPAFGLSESRPELRAPEPLGDFVVRMLKEFGLEQPHVVAPDVGTPACLSAAANHPRSIQEHGNWKRRDRSHRHWRHSRRDRQCTFPGSLQGSDRRAVLLRERSRT